MMIRFWVRLDNAFVYLLRSGDSFSWEIAVRMIPWISLCCSFGSCRVWCLWWCICICLLQILVLGWGLPFELWRIENWLGLQPFLGVWWVSICFCPGGGRVCWIVCKSGYGCNFLSSDGCFGRFCLWNCGVCVVQGSVGWLHGIVLQLHGVEGFRCF